jgi:hypothetical protein
MPLYDVNSIQSFFIEPHTKNLFSEPYIHRIRNKRLFDENKLLIKKGISLEFKMVSAISYEKAVFKDSLTAIKVFQKTNLTELRIFSGLLHSNLFSYYITQTGTSIGIEREQVFDKEKFGFPYLPRKIIADNIERIEDLSKKLFEEKQKPFNSHVQTLEDKKQNLINKLDKEILSSFDLDEQERSLVDYAINFTIPLIRRHTGYEKKLFSALSYKDSFLEDYIHIFLTRFKISFRDKHLEATVWHTNFILGVYFKVVPYNSTDTQLIEWQEKSEPEFIKKIYSLGIEKITEELFIQKDIRGFEKEGFYIIKPNEKKLWHKAIAYLDVNDFADAILEAGKEAYNG